MRVHASLAVLVLISGHGFAPANPSGSAADCAGASTKQRSLSLTAGGCFVPHRSFYPDPTFAADREWPHLTPLNIQRGVLVSFPHKQVHLTTSVFNRGWTDRVLVAGFGWRS